MRFNVSEIGDEIAGQQDDMEIVPSFGDCFEILLESDDVGTLPTQLFPVVRILSLHSLDALLVQVVVDFDVVKAFDVVGSVCKLFDEKFPRLAFLGAVVPAVLCWLLWFIALFISVFLLASSFAAHCNFMMDQCNEIMMNGVLLYC